MKYYTIQNDCILTAEVQEVLTKFYENVLPLPPDYAEGKYIVKNNELVLNPEYEEEHLKKLKEEKYSEANLGAKNYLESGEALYEFEKDKHIEATDGNIAKMTAYALAYVTGQLTPTDKVVWNTKEDETVELTQEQIIQIITGLGQVQADVWSVQYPKYIQAIENAQTIEEVEAIVVEYNSEYQTEETEGEIDG